MSKEKVGELIATYDEYEIVQSNLDLLKENWDLVAENYGYKAGDKFSREVMEAILWETDEIFEKGLEVFAEKVENMFWRNDRYYCVWDIGGEIVRIDVNVVRGILSKIDVGVSMGKVEAYDRGDGFSLVLYEAGSDSGVEWVMVPFKPKYAVGDKLEARVKGWGTIDRGKVIVSDVGGWAKTGGYWYQVTYVMGGEETVVSERDLFRIK